MSGFVISPFYDERRGKWRLLNGNETFYNEKNEMLEWNSRGEALAWWFVWGRMNWPGFENYQVVIKE